MYLNVFESYCNINAHKRCAHCTKIKVLEKIIFFCQKVLDLYEIYEIS